MKELILKFFSTDAYFSQADKVRAQFFYISSVILIVAVFAVTALNTILPSIGFDATTISYILLASVLSFISIVVVRFGGLFWASWSICIGQLMVLMLANPLTGIDDIIDIAIIGYLILLSGLLLEMRSFLVYSAMTIVIMWLSKIVLPENTMSYNAALLVTAVFLIMIMITYYFQRVVSASREEGELAASRERFKLAEINTRITRQASERATMHDALSSTLDLILKNYPQLYHAQVFLIDEDGIQARLIASTGEPGKKLLERGHSLAVGSLSIIGQTTFKGEPVIATAGQDGEHRRNELLPETQVEAAFPLRVGTQIIGALDLQSRESLQFNEYDILSFQSLANSMSLAIDSIRQYDAAKARVEENQRLAEQTRNALREVERLNQRLIGRAWSEYLNTRGTTLGLNVDFEEDVVKSDREWTPTLVNAIQNNNIVHDDRILSLPLRVRGQVIGAMEFEMRDDYELTPEDLELVQEISERFGLAAENTRLIEESQRTAQRETLINEITSRLQSATNVESTLAEAARSLTETLQANRVMIRLGVPSNDSKSENGQKG